MFEISQAKREKVKLFVGMNGPAGAGKTFSALQLAYGLAGDWNKVYLADTENRSALSYAGSELTGAWHHIPYPPSTRGGYHPNNWIALIRQVESIPTAEVLILDSITHEWNGLGGVLQLAEASGKGFSGWKTATPIHNEFINAMLHSRLHIIATMRAKQEYVVEQNDKGKSTPRKLGLKATQRDDTDYEFTVAFDIDIDHNATSTKDRTHLFSSRGGFKIKADVGRELAEWANAGSLSVYEGKQHQREALMAIFTEMKIEDKDKMRQIASLMAGTEMTLLRPKIEEILYAELAQEG